MRATFFDSKHDIVILHTQTAMDISDLIRLLIECVRHRYSAIGYHAKLNPITCIVTSVIQPDFKVLSAIVNGIGILF